MTLPPITTDLTRWNRAGLPRVAYVQANAATHLEAMRAALEARFGADWRRVADVLSGEDVADDVDPVLERYLADAGDSAWEFLRAVARATHVISRHVDAYANEALLGTATQLESVTRIVSLLDYHPAGPSSAATTLAFDVAADEHVVGAGRAVTHQPDDGPKIVFETRHPLTAHAALNGLVHLEADDDPRGLVNPLPLADDVPVVLGAPVVLEHQGDLSVHRITSIARDADDVPTIGLAPAPDPAWRRGRTTVHVNPRDRLTPIGPTTPTVSTTGPNNTLRLAEQPAGLTPYGFAWIADSFGTSFRRIMGIGDHDVSLEEPITDVSRSATVGPALQVSATASTTTSITLEGDWRWLAHKDIGVRPALVFTWVAWSFHGGGTFAPVAQPQPTSTVRVASVSYDDGGGADEPVTTRLTWSSAVGTAPGIALIEPPDAAATGIPVDAPLDDGAGGLPTALQASTATHTENGDIVVLGDEDDLAVAHATAVVGQSDGTTELSTGSWTGSGTLHPATATLYGHFADATRPRDWNVNRTPLAGQHELRLVPAAPAVSVEDVMAVLRPGRLVVLDHDPPAHEQADPSQDAVAVATTVAEVLVEFVGGSAHAARVTLEDPVPEGITAGSLAVRGNAVEATHGETQDEVVLGSGSADQRFQEFTLVATDVSHVPDPSFTTGFAAAVEVQVDGRWWTQVERLQDAEPDTRWYTARLDADGHVVVAFGDGRTGRRLPSGTDNVRARYRTGAGLVGNLAPGSLVDLARPDPAVTTVRQPIAAAGGGSGETADDVRTSAPRSTLALGRAVSLGDYAALAARRGDVWQAVALRGAARRGIDEVVEVVVVPSGGGALPEAQRGRIVAGLLAAGPPGVQVVARGHVLLPVVVDVTVHVDSSAFDPESVRQATHDVLAAALAVEQRRLGAELSRGELFRLAESVVGVETASVRVHLALTPELTAAGTTEASVGHVDGDGHLRRVRAAADQLVALRREPPGLAVTVTEFAP